MALAYPIPNCAIVSPHFLRSLPPTPCLFTVRAAPPLFSHCATNIKAFRLRHSYCQSTSSTNLMVCMHYCRVLTRILSRFVKTSIVYFALATPAIPVLAIITYHIIAGAASRLNGATTTTHSASPKGERIPRRSVGEFQIELSHGVDWGNMFINRFGSSLADLGAGGHIPDRAPTSHETFPCGNKQNPGGNSNGQASRTFIDSAYWPS